MRVLLDERFFLIMGRQTSQQVALLVLKLHGHAKDFLLVRVLWLGMEVAQQSGIGL